MAAESRIGRALAAANPFAGPPRTRTDWVVDSVLFVVAVLVWLWAIPGYGYLWAEVPAWWVRIDLVIGALCTVGIWWRRRFPLLCGVLIGVIGGLAMSAWLAILVAIYTVAANRPVRITLALSALHLVIALPYYYVLPAIPSDFGSWAITIVLLYVAVVSIGMAVRSRRQVIANLVAAAEREREAHREQLGQARQTERSRIAREMHDVLAHRISLLSVHAGALEYRTRSDTGTPLTRAELSEAVTVIRGTAHRALEDLRDVLAVLDPETAADDGTEQPQPSLADVPQLVAEARAAGQPVRLSECGDTDRLPELREPVQRTLYRVVQEGLTNARKHTPGATVEVELAGRVADSVRVSISNPLPVGLTRADIPGAGRGLTGLAERVRIDGGVLTHEVVDGTFRLSAELPWRT